MVPLFLLFWFLDLNQYRASFCIFLAKNDSRLFFILVFSQAIAYYYHGLILDEGNTEKSHGMAVAALQAADEYLRESKRACEAFNMASPLSR